MPSIFQMSGSTPAAWSSSIAAFISSGAISLVPAILVAAGSLDLLRPRGHEQLEQEHPIVLVQPVAEPAQALPPGARSSPVASGL